MPDDIRFLVVERNGTELVAPEEEDFLPEFMPLTVPGIVADNVKDGFSELTGKVSTLLVPIPLINNGTASNGEFIGYNNLLANKAIVVPITGEFVGYSFTQSKPAADWAFEWRMATQTATPFSTESYSNVSDGLTDFVTPYAVTAGEILYLKYIDQGTNAADFGIIVKFKA